jgi:hypothetical protein
MDAVKALALLGAEEAIVPLGEEMYAAKWGPFPDRFVVSAIKSAYLRMGTREALRKLDDFESKELLEAQEFNSGTRYYCPHCHYSISKFAFACPKCKLKLGGGISCRYCGHTYDSHLSICPSCFR